MRPALLLFVVGGDIVLGGGRRRRRRDGELAKKHRQSMNRMAWMRSLGEEHERLSRETLTEEEIAENSARSARASSFQLQRVEYGKRLEFTPSEFRGAARHLFYCRRHRLIACAIPKVACTEIIKLMYRMCGDENWKANPHFRGDKPTLERLGIEEANDLMNDPSWTKFVFFRDPLRRLASAYLDKFVESPKRGIHANYGIRFFHETHLSFEKFARLVSSNNTDASRQDGLHRGTNAHWKPQRYMCALETFAPLYNFVGSHEHLREHAETLLRSMGLWNEYGKTGWAPRATRESNSTTIYRDELFARKSPHKTESASRYDELYGHDGLEELVRTAYEMDYEFLGRVSNTEFRFSSSK